MPDDEPVDPSAPTVGAGETIAETAAPAGRSSTTSIPGERIGKFVVIETLGRGAMGVVFAAFDPDLDRKVALKLLRKRAHDSAASMRLLREARAMAKVSHPNVLAIHEVGTVGEQVFLAMEHAAGGTLRAWCTTAPRPWREVVARFVQAGRGLAAAHEAGLVHRDFKPENVLLTKDGVVRVADFGIVSSGEPRGESVPPEVLDVSLTTTGTLIGTPAYMAPEQHRCEEVGPAADQFAFCVSLWEALYGVRPFAGDHYAELAVNVLEDNVSEPPADRDVPRWVRDIVRRGLHPKPAERWPSMTALVAALENDPSVVRKRRVLIAAVAGSIACLGGVSAYALLRDPGVSTTCDAMEARLAGVWDAPAKQALHAAFTSTNVSYADDTYARVAQTLDQYARDWVGARSEACRLDEIQTRRDVSPRIECLEGRLAELGALVKVLTKTPHVLDTAAVAADRLVPVSACSDPATLAAITPPSDPATSAKLHELRDRQADARALDLAGQYFAAFQATEPLVAEAERIGYAPMVAATLSLRGNIETALGNAEAAEATLRRTLEVAADSHDDALAVGTWSALILVVGTMRGRPDEALQMRTAAEAALRRAGRKPDAEGVLLLSIGHVLEAKQQFVEAQKLFDQALALMKSAKGPDDLRSGIILAALGSAAHKRDDNQRAVDQLGEALVILEKRLGPEHPSLREVYYDRGEALDDLGRHEEAARSFARSLELVVKANGPENVEVAQIERKLGLQLLLLHRLEEARPHLEHAVAVRDKLLGPEHEYTMSALTALGELSLAQGKLDESRTELDRARTTYAKTKPGSPELADSLTDLAQVFLAQGQPAQARDAVQRALDIGDATKASAAVLAVPRFVLAKALWDTGQHARAIELGRAAKAAFDSHGSTMFTGRVRPGADTLAEEMDAWLATRG